MAGFQARLNLVIYFLREHELSEAFNLLKDLEPTTPQEYILKGVVNAALGQEKVSQRWHPMAPCLCLPSAGPLTMSLRPA